MDIGVDKELGQEASIHVKFSDVKSIDVKEIKCCVQ